MVHEKPDGHLRVSLVTEKSNAFVQMLQKPDGGFVVQDVRGSEIFTAKGKSFTEFRERHGDYCKNRLFPLFSHLGVTFKEDLFKAPARPKAEKKEAASTKKDSPSKSGVRVQSIEVKKGARLAVPRPAIRLEPKR